MMITRRGLLGSLGTALIAAPAIVRASSIMPVKAIEPVATLAVDWGPSPSVSKWVLVTHDGRIFDVGDFSLSPGGLNYAKGDTEWRVRCDR